MRSEVLPLAASLAALLAGCGAGAFQRFPETDPMWVDDDMRPFAERPEEYFSPFAWDGADQMFFGPMSAFLAVRPGGEAVNVNAVDEVPDSSWFQNRIGRHPMTVARLVRGPCEDGPLDAAGPITVTDAKPNGANPGFIVEDAEGRKFLLKFDGEQQPERATAADVIGTLMYWAAGYHSPCNRNVYFDREVLRIGDDATAQNERGDEEPLTWEHIDTALENASRHADGRIRGTSSRFLPGRPIGPWRYQETRGDDPNDVIPHQDRRELRGMRVLAAWMNHFDSREQNTLAMWIETDGGRGYVRHNMIDFGESFGSMWPNPRISRRLGHAYYLDLPYLFADFVTLGVIERPWHRNEHGAAGPTLGYFDVETFRPDRWHPGYPNPAFGRCTERDAAWMARILSQLTDEHVRAMVGAAELSNRVVHDELVRILIGRRDATLRRWFRELSPLTQPRVVPTSTGARLCLRDFAVESGVRPAGRDYAARAWVHDGGLSEVPVSPARPEGGLVCLDLPGVTGDPGYLVVDVRGDPEPGPARVHLYVRGSAYRVVGLERPDGDAPPG